VSWQASGEKEIFERAREKVNGIVANTQLNRLSPEADKTLDKKMDSVLKRRGIKLEELKTLLPHD